MVNISSPSWREDAPSAEETSLAQLIGARNPMAAANLMIPEMQRNAQAQDAYHDQIAQNNDIQRQAITQAAQEARIKGIGNILEHAQPGSLAAIRSMMPDMVPDAANSAELEQSLRQKAAAVNAAGLGKGNEGGIVPGPGAMPQGFSLGTPALVQAASINSAGRIAAANIGAAGRGDGETTTETLGSLANPIQHKYRGPPHAVGALIPSAGGGGGGSGMPPQAQRDEIDRHMATLPAAARDWVTKAAAANGGVPVVVPVNIGGRVVNRLKGADGKAY